MTQQQANTMMKQPPNVIAQKDLMYLEDMLSWNLALCKQAKHYKMEVSDQDVMNELDSIYQMHKKHYNQLLELLQNNNNQ
jgi:hypothetical protein